jgi:hypothetical protein
LRFLCRGTKGFHFVDSSGSLLAKDAASGGSHHDIFLDADAAKIPVGFEPVVADEAVKLFFSFPLADEFGNEEDARLDREDESRLERAGQSQ